MASGVGSSGRWVRLWVDSRTPVVKACACPSGVPGWYRWWLPDVSSCRSLCSWLPLGLTGVSFWLLAVAPAAWWVQLMSSGGSALVGCGLAEYLLFCVCRYCQTSSGVLSACPDSTLIGSIYAAAGVSVV